MNAMQRLRRAELAIVAIVVVAVLGLAVGVSAWERSPLNGANGAPGKGGLPGLNGTNGRNGTNGTDGGCIQNSLAPGYIVGPCQNGVNGVNGTNGTNGHNGLNGRNGTNGVNGTNGWEPPAYPNVTFKFVFDVSGASGGFQNTSCLSIQNGTVMCKTTLTNYGSGVFEVLKVNYSYGPYFAYTPNPDPVDAYVYGYSSVTYYFGFQLWPGTGNYTVEIEFMG